MRKDLKRIVRRRVGNWETRWPRPRALQAKARQKKKLYIMISANEDIATLINGDMEEVASGLEEASKSLLERLIVQASEESAVIDAVDVRRCYEIGNRYGVSVSLDPSEVTEDDNEITIRHKLLAKRRTKLAQCAATAIAQKIAEYVDQGYRLSGILFPTDGNFAAYSEEIAKILRRAVPYTRFFRYTTEEAKSLRRDILIARKNLTA